MASASNSEKRTALDLTMCSICEVEQLPVCTRTTFGGGPSVRLKAHEVLVLCEEDESIAPANFQIVMSDVLPRPAALTCIEPGNKSAS